MTESMPSAVRVGPSLRSCADPIEVINQAFDPGMRRLAAGCIRLEPVRRIPAVTFGAELVPLTGSSTISRSPADGTDTAVELAAAAQLREVGETSPPGSCHRQIRPSFRSWTVPADSTRGSAAMTASANTSSVTLSSRCCAQMTALIGESVSAHTLELR